MGEHLSFTDFLSLYNFFKALNSLRKHSANIRIIRMVHNKHYTPELLFIIIWAIFYPLKLISKTKVDMKQTVS